MPLDQNDCFVGAHSLLLALGPVLQISTIFCGPLLKVDGSQKGIFAAKSSEITTLVSNSRIGAKSFENVSETIYWEVRWDSDTVKRVDDSSGFGDQNIVLFEDSLKPNKLSRSS